MFHETTGHLKAIGIKTSLAGKRFLFCRDKAIKQHRSQLHPKWTNVSVLETFRPASQSTSLAGITKPYSNVYAQNQFTDLEQEHPDFLCTLQSFTDSGHKLNPDILERERKAWTVQYNDPLPLVSQRASPTQALHDEQRNSDKVKDVVKDMR